MAPDAPVLTSHKSLQQSPERRRTGTTTSPKEVSPSKRPRSRVLHYCNVKHWGWVRRLREGTQCEPAAGSKLKNGRQSALVFTSTGTPAGYNATSPVLSPVLPSDSARSPKEDNEVTRPQRGSQRLPAPPNSPLRGNMTDAETEHHNHSVGVPSEVSAEARQIPHSPSLNHQSDLPDESGNGSGYEQSELSRHTVDALGNDEHSVREGSCISAEIDAAESNVQSEKRSPDHMTHDCNNEIDNIFDDDVGVADSKPRRERDDELGDDKIDGQEAEHQVDWDHDVMPERLFSESPEHSNSSMRSSESNSEHTRRRIEPHTSLSVPSEPGSTLSLQLTRTTTPASGTARQGLSMTEILRKVNSDELDEARRRDSFSSSRMSEEPDEWVFTMLVLSRADKEFKNVMPFKARIDTGSRYSLTYRSTLKDMDLEPFLIPSNLLLRGLGGHEEAPIGLEPVLWMKEKGASPSLKIYLENFYVLEDVKGLVRDFDFLLGRDFIRSNRIDTDRSSTAAVDMFHLAAHPRVSREGVVISNGIVARRLLQRAR